MITAAYKVFLIVTQKSVVFFALATSLDYIVVGIILICFYKAKKGQELRFSADYGKKTAEIQLAFYSARRDGVRLRSNG